MGSNFEQNPIYTIHRTDRSDISPMHFDELLHKHHIDKIFDYLYALNPELYKNMQSLIINLRNILETMRSDSLVSTNDLFKMNQLAWVNRESYSRVPGINALILEKIEQMSLLENIDDVQVFELCKELLSWLDQIVSDKVEIDTGWIEERQKANHYPYPDLSMPEYEARQRFFNSVCDRIDSTTTGYLRTNMFDDVLKYYLLYISELKVHPKTNTSNLGISSSPLGKLYRQETESWLVYVGDFLRAIAGVYQSSDPKTVEAAIEKLLKLVDIRNEKVLKVVWLYGQMFNPPRNSF